MSAQLETLMNRLEAERQALYGERNALDYKIGLLNKKILDLDELLGLAEIGRQSLEGEQA